MLKNKDEFRKNRDKTCCEQLGKLLASVHSIDTGWFQPFKQQIVNEHSLSKKMGGHVWTFFTRFVGVT